jgi:metal-responsive CopG/Arc/MetJ family transcriptional regulator
MLSDLVSVRLPAGTLQRLDRARHRNKDRASLIRLAVESELQRREHARKT